MIDFKITKKIHFSTSNFGKNITCSKTFFKYNINVKIDIFNYSKIKLSMIMVI